MRSEFKWAAESCAASFLEICPDAMLSDVWVGHLGFYVEYTLPFTPTEEMFKVLEQRMREKLKGPRGTHVMSAKNLIEYYKAKKQIRLARRVDRSLPELPVLTLDGHVAPLEGAIDIDVPIKELYLENRPNCIFGMAFGTKEELKAFQKAKRAPTEELYHVEGEDLYWLPKGIALRKEVERWIETYIKDLGYEEVDFSGDIAWYGKQKVFTILEEEIPSRYECGLLDYPIQKVYFIANSDLQVFNAWDKVVPLILEEVSAGVKIWSDQMVDALVQKREYTIY